MKLMKKAVPHTRKGMRNALVTICLIQLLPTTHITISTALTINGRIRYQSQHFYA